jgi:hypothetical protein
VCILPAFARQCNAHRALLMFGTRKTRQGFRNAALSRSAQSDSMGITAVGITACLAALRIREKHSQPSAIHSLFVNVRLKRNSGSTHCCSMHCA